MPSKANQALHQAAAQGDLEKVKSALADGAYLESWDPSRSTALTLAAGGGHLPVVEYLLERGASVRNGRDTEFTPLMAAASTGRKLEIVEVLVRAGANVNATSYGQSVLMQAAAGGQLAIVKRLIELGADPHASDEDFVNTALDYALAGKHREVAKHLEELGVIALRMPMVTFAKAIAREFGGRAIECQGCVLVNPKITGLKAQVTVKASACELVLADFRPAFPDTNPELGGWFAVNADRKPRLADSEPVLVPEAFAKSSRSVSRSAGAQSIPEEVVRIFCRSNEDDFDALRLEQDEIVWFIGNTLRLEAKTFDLPKMKDRVAVLRRIFERSSAPAPVQRCWSQEAFVLKVGKKLTAAVLSLPGGHQFGGRLAHPVGCPACGEPASLVLRLHLGDKVLPKSTLGRPDLPVLWCQDCGDWGPIFFDLSGATPLPISDQTSIKIRQEFSKFDLEPRAVSLAAVQHGKQSGRRSKVGGSPGWIQTEEIPECPKCKQGMVFVLQLASSPHIGFCDMGVLFAFVCPDCKVGATLIQSH